MTRKEGDLRVTSSEALQYLISSEARDFLEKVCEDVLLYQPEDLQTFLQLRFDENWENNKPVISVSPVRDSAEYLKSHPVSLYMRQFMRRLIAKQPLSPAVFLDTCCEEVGREVSEELGVLFKEGKTYDELGTPRITEDLIIVENSLQVSSSHPVSGVGDVFNIDGLGTVLALPGDDRTLLCDALSGKTLAMLEHTSQPAECVRFGPFGKVVAIASKSPARCVRLFHIKTTKEITLVQDLAGHMHSLAFSPDGKMLAACGINESSDPKESVVFVWDTRTARPIVTLQVGGDLGPQPRSLCFSPAGAFLAAGDSAGRVLVWEVQPWQGQPMDTWPYRGSVDLNGSPITSLDFADGDVVAADHEALTLVDAANCNVLQKLECGSPVLSVAHNGTLLAAGCQDGVVYIWSTTRYRQVGKLLGVGGAVTSVRFTADGALLAAASKQSPSAHLFSMDAFRKDEAAGSAGARAGTGASGPSPLTAATVG